MRGVGCARKTILYKRLQTTRVATIEVAEVMGHFKFQFSLFTMFYVITAGVLYLYIDQATAHTEYNDTVGGFALRALVLLGIYLSRRRIHCERRRRDAQVDETTWNGEDAFRPRGMSGTTMVSKRFRDACVEHDITNAVFIPAEQAGHDFYPGVKDLSQLRARRRQGS